MYEPHHSSPISVRRFVLRIPVRANLAIALIGISLFVGMIGYAHHEPMSWLDAFLNSAPILLGGMGLVKTASLAGNSCVPVAETT